MAKARKSTTSAKRPSVATTEVRAATAADTAVGVTAGATDASLSRQAIAMRAYELFVHRGAADGNDVEDWLTAERELAGAG